MVKCIIYVEIKEGVEVLYTYPDYYDKFKCIAGECEATCCAGWQIVIDEKSLENYRKISHKDSRIDWEEGVFKQSECKRCAFLNEDNLCDMFMQWGEEALCETCKRYPRHIEEFENVREYTLSLSCPEAARIILENKEKVTFVEKEDDTDEFDEDFDVLMYDMLLDARRVMYEILQNRDLSIKERVEIICEMAEKLQDAFDEGGVFSCNEIIVHYEGKPINASADIDAFERFRKLYEMEVLNDSWVHMTDVTAALIYESKDIEKNLHDEFEKWLDENIKDHHIIWEQILVYFISTYLCGAVYDDNILGKVNMTVTSVVCIYEMLLGRWYYNGKEIDFDDIVFIAYMYSRELEHSDINLEIMEE